MKKKHVKTLRLFTPSSTSGDAVKKNNTAIRTFKGRVKRSLHLSLIVGLLGGGMASFGVTAPVAAAACPAPATDLGTLTLTVNVPAEATYTIWSRMMAPDATNNAINLQIDSADCFNVGGGGLTANAWKWVNYADGSTTTNVRKTLTAGSHTLKYIGTKAGVSLDRVIVTSDPTCTPTDLGNNCQSGDSTGPVVNVVSPTNGQTITGAVTLTATATDADSGVKEVKFLVDGAAIGTDTTSPYSVSWNSATATNGTHNITAQASDNANNITNSTPVSVTVTGGGTGGKQGDLNNDGRVTITDLSILLSNWSRTSPTAAQGDINGDGRVNITDLSILLSRWG